jgi:hypothetical protein
MSLGEKTLHFRDNDLDLQKLVLQISDHLEAEGFHVHSSVHHHKGTVIQAKKGGFLTKLIDADRALTIVVGGTPDDARVHIGIGRWVEHLAVGTIEALILPHLFIAVDVAEVAWNLEIERKLVKTIEEFAGTTAETPEGTSAETAAGTGSGVAQPEDETAQDQGTQSPQAQDA